MSTKHLHRSLQDAKTWIRYLYVLVLVYQFQNSFDLVYQLLRTSQMNPALIILREVGIDTRLLAWLAVLCYVPLVTYAVALLGRKTRIERALAGSAFLGTWLVGSIYFLLGYVGFNIGVATATNIGYLEAGVQSWLLAFFIPLRANATQRLRVPQYVLNDARSNLITIGRK